MGGLEKESQSNFAAFERMLLLLCNVSPLSLDIIRQPLMAPCLSRTHPLMLWGHQDPISTGLFPPLPRGFLRP